MHMKLLEAYRFGLVNLVIAMSRIVAIQPKDAFYRNHVVDDKRRLFFKL